MNAIKPNFTRIESSISYEDHREIFINQLISTTKTYCVACGHVHVTGHFQLEGICGNTKWIVIFPNYLEFIDFKF